MNASQDKVQGILQTLLEESIPLVHKGIFTTQQLQQAMHEREKNENNMLKSSFKLSDYLKSIEYEYSLERMRRHRISQLSISNPLFKKHSKTDFIIIKRIIRLWDRATHKYKYSLDLWKQYLAFCVQIESKKHFYKALSAAIRMMPHEEQLWKIGAQYQIQYGNNLWKARKILIRGLKLNQKKESIWETLVRFELFFLSTLYLREKAIKGEEGELKFVMPGEDQQEIQGQMMDEQEEDDKFSEGVNLQKHDEVVILVIQQAISKFQEREKKIEMLHRFINIIKEAIKMQKEQFVLRVLKRLLKQVLQGIPVSERAGLEQQKQSVKYLKKKEEQKVDKVFLEAQEALKHPQNHLSSFINKTLAPFLTRPKKISELLVPLVKKNYTFMIEYICTSSLLKSYLIPHELLQILISSRHSLEQHHRKYLQSQIKRISVESLKTNPKLLTAIIEYQKEQGKHKQNNDIYRKLSLACRSEPEIVERCLYLIQKKQ